MTTVYNISEYLCERFISDLLLIGSYMRVYKIICKICIKILYKL